MWVWVWWLAAFGFALLRIIACRVGRLVRFGGFVGLTLDFYCGFVCGLFDICLFLGLELWSLFACVWFLCLGVF